MQVFLNKVFLNFEVATGRKSFPFTTRDNHGRCKRNAHMNFSRNVHAYEICTKYFGALKSFQKFQRNKSRITASIYN